MSQAQDDQLLLVLYAIVGVLGGLAAFVASWWYAIDRWGWFIGIGVCWLPALCIGIFAGLAWPLLGVAALLLYMSGRPIPLLNS